MRSRCVTEHSGMVMSNPTYKLLGKAGFLLGFASIIASIAIWFTEGGAEASLEARTHAELFGIFVGLWAPTFFILSNRLDRFAE